MSDEMPLPERPKYRRIEYTYTVPESIAEESGHTHFSMTRLSGEEEIMAAASADNSKMKLQHMLCMYALKTVDGKAVNPSDGELDVIFNDPESARLRTLMVSAYNDLHGVMKEDMVALAASRVASYR